MCVHDESMPEADCLYSPSHRTADGRTPAQVIEQYIAVLTDYQSSNEETQVVEEISYGEAPKQKIDVWGHVGDRMLFFIHGGFWMVGDRKLATSAVPTAVERGVAVAAVGYEFASVEHPLEELQKDIVKAVQCLLSHYPSVQSFTISGHSAGAHLAFKALSHFRSERRISGLALLCGVYEVEGVVDTYVGRATGLTAETARVCTCRAEEVEGAEVEVLMVDAENDSPPMIDAQRRLLDDLQKKGVLVKRKVIPGSDHFSIVENLGKSTPEAALLLELCLRNA